MEDFLDFMTLREPSVRYVVLSCILLGAAASTVGVFGFLRKRSLVGETVAHSMLPGIGLAFIISGSREPIFLVTGAVITGWMSMGFMNWLTNRGPIKIDLALAITLTGFFAIGIGLMTYIQRGSFGDHSGLDHYIFGRAAAMKPDDIRVFGGLAIFVFISVLLLFKEFMGICFNKEFLSVLGLPVRFLEFAISFLTILAISSGIKAVGIVLMAALMIIPAAAARYWTGNLRWLLTLAIAFGIIAGIGGAYISFQAHSLPTGPFIVIVLATITAISVVFAPEKGLFSRWARKRRMNRRVAAENFVKELYQILEKKTEQYARISKTEFLKHVVYERESFFRSLRWAVARGWIVPVVDGMKITEKGLIRGRELNRLHRLWEIYLARKAHTPLEKVHHSAEIIEHILTPELEAEIRIELDLCENFSPQNEIHIKA